MTMKITNNLFMVALRSIGIQVEFLIRYLASPK
jgi:hypothetical protein